MRRRRFRIRRRSILETGRAGDWKVRDEHQPYRIQSFRTHAAAIAYVSGVIKAETAAYPERHLIGQISEAEFNRTSYIEHIRAGFPECRCGSVDKYGDDLGEHSPSCEYHLAALAAFGGNHGSEPTA